MRDNIILIGFMGCGKSSVGRALSQALSYRHLDTDLEIEKREGQRIKDIFSHKGEEYFRKAETSTITELNAGLSEAVVSTGGGLPLRPENADILKKMGFVVYLRANEETIWERLKNDKTRPLLQKPSPRDEIRKLLDYRQPLYELAAHMALDVDGKSIEEIVVEITRNFGILRKRGAADEA